MRRDLSRASTEVTSVALAGEVSQGAAIDRSCAGESVFIPQSKIDVGELVFRVSSGIDNLGMDTGDLLIFQPRNPGHAETGELVVAAVDDRVLIGHWWDKRGCQMLLDGEFAPITEDAIQILGAITLIVRPTSRNTHQPKG